MRVLSRIAVFRDCQSQKSYESLIFDCGKEFGSRSAPELLALLIRCYQTLSIPYAVNYIRQFGEFSKKYISSRVASAMKRSFFDFVRFNHKGGVRQIPCIISRPWSMNAYARLLKPCSAKRYIYHELRVRGQVPRGSSPALPESIEKSQLESFHQELYSNMKLRSNVNERRTVFYNFSAEEGTSYHEYCHPMYTFFDTKNYSAENILNNPKSSSDVNSTTLSEQFHGSEINSNREAGKTSLQFEKVVDFPYSSNTPCNQAKPCDAFKDAFSNGKVFWKQRRRRIFSSFRDKNENAE